MVSLALVAVILVFSGRYYLIYYFANHGLLLTKNQTCYTMFVCGRTLNVSGLLTTSADVMQNADTHYIYVSSF